MKTKKTISMLVMFLVVGFSFFVSADIFSFNSGGDNQIIINPDLFIEGFFFSSNRIPVLTSVILSSISGNNYTTDNLTISLTGYDLDHDYITNITDWRVGGTSIAVLNMPFDKKITSNSTGAVRDYSTYQNNGTLGGGNVSRVPTWNYYGKINGSYIFDGVDDYINVPISSVPQQFTITAWIKLNQTGREQHFAEFTNTQFYVSSSNKLNTSSWSTASGTTSLIAGTWYFATLVRNSTNVIIYLNGNSEGMGVLGVNATSPFIIGNLYSLSGNNDFNGSIDEVKIFNRVLSEEQIKLIYNSELAGYQTKTLSSLETEKGETWQVAVTPNDYKSDGVTVLSNSLTIENIPPNDATSVMLRSLNSRNESDTDLNCSAYISDKDDSSLTASVKWIKNSVDQFTLSYSGQANNSVFYALLDDGNTTLGDVWRCSIRTYDGSAYSNWVNSNNLTIIDITKPNITIISPQPINYTNLTIPFNVSVQDNEAASMCWYSLDGAANITMIQLNATNFGSLPSLGPGPHDLIYYCNDTSNNVNWTNVSFEILNEAAIAIDLSNELLATVKWNVISLPANDLDALGNNGTGRTMYWVNISVTNIFADLYVRADGDLFNEALDVLNLSNENFTYVKNDPIVNTTNVNTMSTSYILIGDALGNGDIIYLKFFLDAPNSQPAGVYLNNLEFKAVRDGQSP